MPFQQRTSLAVKLTTLIVASAGIIFVLMILFNYFFLKNTYIAQARETAKLLSESKAQKVSLILARAEGVAATLAPIVAGGTRSEAELTQLLQDAVKHNPEISAMAVAFEPSAYQPGLRYFAPYVYRQGTTIQQSYLGSSRYNYFNWMWYEVPQELNRALWSEPYQEPTSDTIVITYSVPFYRQGKAGKSLSRSGGRQHQPGMAAGYCGRGQNFRSRLCLSPLPAGGVYHRAPKGVDHEPEYKFCGHAYRQSRTAAGRRENESGCRRFYPDQGFYP